LIELKNREKKFIIIGIIIIAVSLAYARVFYPLYICNAYNFENNRNI
jgi:ABC-type multidrug transport system permease subunit